MRLAVITDDCDHTHSVGIARVNLVEVRVILDNTLESSEAFFLDICVECVEVLKVRSYKSLASDTTFEVSQLAENLFFFVFAPPNRIESPHIYYNIPRHNVEA